MSLSMSTNENSLLSHAVGMPADIVEPYGRIVRVRFGTDKECRIRPIVTRSRAQPTFRFPSLTMGRICEGEGHELDAFRLADCDPAVPWFAEQCCEITYLNDHGEETRHYPDLLSYRKGSFVFWEEKPRRFAEAEDILARTEMLARELPALGFEYEVKYAEVLAAEPRISVAKLLLRFGYRSMTLVDRWQLQHKIDNGSELTWGHACAGELGEFGREILCRAVLEGILAVNMSSPLTRETRFEPGTLEVWP